MAGLDGREELCLFHRSGECTNTERATTIAALASDTGLPPLRHKISDLWKWPRQRQHHHVYRQHGISTRCRSSDNDDDDDNNNNNINININNDNNSNNNDDTNNDDTNNDDNNSKNNNNRNNINNNNNITTTTSLAHLVLVHEPVERNLGGSDCPQGSGRQRQVQGSGRGDGYGRPRHLGRFVLGRKPHGFLHHEVGQAEGLVKVNSGWAARAGGVCGVLQLTQGDLDMGSELGHIVGLCGTHRKGNKKQCRNGNLTKEPQKMLQSRGMPRNALLLFCPESTPHNTTLRRYRAQQRPRHTARIVSQVSRWS